MKIFFSARCLSHLLLASLLGYTLSATLDISLVHRSSLIAHRSSLVAVSALCCSCICQIHSNCFALESVPPRHCTVQRTEVAERFPLISPSSFSQGPTENRTVRARLHFKC